LGLFLATGAKIKIPAKRMRKRGGKKVDWDVEEVGEPHLMP